MTLVLPRARRYSKDEVAAAGRDRDSWWTVLMVDPAAVRLVRLLARTPTTPGQLTAAGGMFAVAAAAAYLTGDPRWAWGGSVLFQVGFLLDCMDGRLARLTGQASVTGAWLSALIARGRLPVCGSALLAGRYGSTGDDRYLLLALLVVTVAAVFQAGGGDRPGPVRIRRLGRRRLRTRPVGEVEFAMAVCVFAPQSRCYLPVIVVAAALALLGEVAAAVCGPPRTGTAGSVR